MNKNCCRFLSVLLCGVVFHFSLALASGPRLAIVPTGNTVKVSWPVTGTNFVLQSTVSLVTNNWLAVTNPAPVVVNNTNTVTYTNNSLTRFFRLFFTNTTSVPAGMVLIPAGAFTMGDINDTNINGDAAPVTVTNSAFYMDSNLVSYAQWQTTYNWATAAGYVFNYSGSGKAASHPVQTIDWYDAVKWCNARSQQTGLKPVYYTDAALTLVYTNGETDSVFVNWTNSGFRLPTEAEWEKAARGGQAGQRFPLGNTISESQANYFGNTGYFYDLGPSGWNSIAFSGSSPYTTVVGRFAPNGYGLFDMAGNVSQWCWDWYATYAGGTDPRGPSTSTGNRVFRGGRNDNYAVYLRCGDRNHQFPFFPGNADPGIGFRCVKAP